MINKTATIIFCMAMIFLCIVAVKIYSAIPAFIEKINAQKVQEVKSDCIINIQGRCFIEQGIGDIDCSKQSETDPVTKQPVKLDNYTHCTYSFVIVEKSERLVKR